MEAKTKIIAAVAVIVMCAAGLVGAGYAYTATTVNDGNTATSEYITLNQGEDGKYQFANNVKIGWNTYDREVAADTYKTLFYLPGTTAKVADDGVSYDLYQVGETLTLFAAPQAGGVEVNPLDCVIAVNGFTKDTDYVLFIEVTVPTANDPVVTYLMLTANNTFNTYATDDWDGASKFAMVWNDTEHAYQTATVKFFVGYTTASGGIDKPHVAGTHPSITANPVQNATVTFSLYVEDARVAVESVTISGTTSVTVGNDVQLTATVLPASATDKKVIWSTSNAAIATVDASGKVHGVTAGQVTITAMTVDGLFTDTETITVSA